MTELHPEPAPEESDEADLADRQFGLDAELEADLDDPAELGLEDDAWDADLADVADQRTEAPLDDEI